MVENVKMKKFSCFAQAIQIVSLTQVSSAFVERCFSYLKQIIKTSSQNQLEETIEMRLMLELNKVNII